MKYTRSDIGDNTIVYKCRRSFVIESAQDGKLSIWNVRFRETEYQKITLFKYCVAEDGSFNAGICNGYIAGVMDVLNNKERDADFSFCLSKNPDITQIVDIVRSWLEQNPKLPYFSAPNIIAKAMSEVWPCK